MTMQDRSPGADRCIWCGAVVVFRRHVQTGILAPIDVDGDPAGQIAPTIVLEQGYRYRTLGRGELPLAEKELTTLHEETCPNVADWRTPTQQELRG